MLVGANIAQRRYLPIESDEANRITRGPDTLQDGPFGQIADRCHGLELGIAADRLKNGSWNTRHPVALIDQTQPAPCIFRPPKC